jgi:ribosomal protein L11 methyltransferase
MPFLELSFSAPDDTAGGAEGACFELGALSVTLADAGDDAILEPAPGTTPLWPHVKITALFRADAEQPTLTRSLCMAVPGLAAADVTARIVADRAWEREWLRDFHAMRFGRHLWVAPRHETIELPDAVVVSMDPGLAFGTGTHATTALCLEWLDSARLAGRSIIDYGCGSGVLAVAALKLGAARALAIDIEPQALAATLANAASNGVAERIEVGEPYDVAEPADILIANILAGPLIELAPRLARLVVPGGNLVLSGLMATETHAVTLAYQSWFHMNAPYLRETWARIDGTRRPN